MVKVGGKEVEDENLTKVSHLYFSSFLIISIGGFLFFTYTPTYKGVIIESGQSIWVVPDAENIKYKSKQELRETYMYQGVEFTLPTYMSEKR